MGIGHREWGIGHREWVIGNTKVKRENPGFEVLPFDLQFNAQCPMPNAQCPMPKAQLLHIPR
ncbi:MAG: hypothetical protein WBL95_15965 [Microcoleus sp.]